MSVLQVAIFAFTLWMGLYLLERAGHQPGMYYIGLGLIVYAIGLGTLLIAAASNQIVTWQALIAVATMLPCGTALFHLWKITSELPRIRRIATLAYIAAVFFIMTTTLLIIPQSILSNTDLLVALSFDIVLMGYVMAWLNTRLEGEALLPDALRSLLLTAGGSLLFGGQVAFIIMLQGETSPLFQFLLLEIITSVIIIVVFNRRILRFLDRFIFWNAPALQSYRETLRETAAQLARSNPSIGLAQLDFDEFNHLARRALRNIIHPQRLVASPLMQLPLIDERLSHDSASATTLERANTLRLILADSIQKLKPPHDDSETGITDDWRHYNVLYYPYIVGISPYSTRLPLNKLDSDTREVIEWFRTHVPERTFYNWQKAAVTLIAHDLYDQLQGEKTEAAVNWQ